ncbi:RNA polymerase sigma factor [Tenacibaculum sp. 190524A02b]|uniref:RNA polymerase sigma-70 factor, ECF subfamily n=1 Tax=Tenacibaculum vairaonense TaxID=3137860 RepID=A0ABM9PRI9_9FLAO
MNSKDKHLIDLVLKGNNKAFKQIITNTQGLVIQIVYKMIDNSLDREDLIQEIYLKVYHKLSHFKYKSKLSTWIGTIAYNTCLNFLEKKRIPTIKVFDKEGNESWSIINIKSNHNYNETDQYLFKKERLNILQEAIDKLPPAYKTLITLFHNEELSYEEISKITSLPEGTLKSYLYRARKKLRNDLLNTYKKDDL